MSAIPDLTLDSGLPANVDAEKTILGAILLDNAAHSEAAETRQRELALLAALQAKYSPAEQVPMATEASMPVQDSHFGYQPSLF